MMIHSRTMEILVGAFMAKGSLVMTAYLLAGTLIGALALGQAERLRSFLRAGLLAARPEGWGILSCTPGQAPLQALRQA